VVVVVVVVVVVDNVAELYLEGEEDEAREPRRNPRREEEESPDIRWSKEDGRCSAAAADGTASKGAMGGSASLCRPMSSWSNDWPTAAPLTACGSCIRIMGESVADNPLLLAATGGRSCLIKVDFVVVLLVVAAVVDVFGVVVPARLLAIMSLMICWEV
jgi:hypothetical protein